MASMHAVSEQTVNQQTVSQQAVSQQAVKPQDSGQPRPGTPGDPLAGRNDENHPGTRKRHQPAAKDEPAEGTDPSLAGGRTRKRKPG